MLTGVGWGERLRLTDLIGLAIQVRLEKEM